ncbi:inositol polyphosphate-4-phosphatase type I A-like [Macrosteles quadrilineatus]|uniref:inositol polyphosphate-4-phosphatase type I A-like n=1 Tax=Macrosteles quadrilineatus TaxID=74068 RepID=UPI0023E3466D|nr:inositol polyphosphate-4-phosphatase type I A-like [Macrosteles quadrilineatus]
MRYNKQELLTLATQPSQKFDKEGVLLLRERQEGFFRRTERKDSKRGKRGKLRELSCYSGTSKVSLERWCRLRGNLLFYFKTRDQWSEPLGVVVLEQCSVKLDPPATSNTTDGPFGFSLVFEGGLSQHVAALSLQERDQWLQAIQLSSHECMRTQLLALQQRLETRRGQDPDLDIQMWRLRRNQTLDPCELPLCEVSLSCDNLLCDGHGRPPNPVLLVHVYIPEERVLLKYAKTEVIEKSSNPSFLNTVSFRSSDGLNASSKVRLTVYDVREPVSQTATPLGSACITLGTLQDCERLRIPLKSCAGTTVGFLSLLVWALEREDQGTPSTESTPCRTASIDTAAIHCHRRSQSLPPRLGSKLKLPHQGQLRLLFANPTVQTYRFHSGLGGDISVHEVMAESRLCFTFPQQLLAVWIQEEKELLQEVAGMGELVEPWHSKQVQLLDRHLHLLHLYSQASENLAAHKGGFFKPSSRKNDRSLEFAPVNLHLQRMWVQNDTLKKCDFYDVVTVGAFTAHSHKNKNGGLIKLLQQIKESPMRSHNSSPGIDKITVASDAIQAIKQLRREVVEAMRSLMRLAKDKQTLGMLPICEDMISKTRTLLTLWDPGLVEEALSFVEKNKMGVVSLDVVGGNNGIEESLTLSPFRRITQQLSFNELKSPDYDELITPDSPRCLKGFWGDLHPKTSTHREPSENQFVIFPDAEEDVEKDDKSIDENSNVANLEMKPLETEEEEEDEEEDDGSLPSMSSGNDCDVGKRFLDTHVMSRSPSANYYKPTDEPEPWDLTQLNIEASVMFLDTHVMSSSPSANYYKPTDEPEPWDLTQLNIETSVMFLDTHVMSSSPSANYYKPTDEPEPWDLTQLNIEASVMFLDTHVMSSSPSANYYKPTDEPEPWDLTQLNIEASVMFLDTHVMSSSPSANYYKPTDEPEPWDLTQLNIEASVMFLDTHVMSSSPSANYYKPTDEPEPWDLTQLNIEASVMFLDTHVMSSSPSANYYKPTDEPEPWDLTQLNIEASVMFLDTHVMSSSPSANYYKPTDEPEPWDLTQLNIEASVMCLVSKVKFLCGRCGSPAVRLRNQRGMGRSKSFRSELSAQQEVVTSQPTSVGVNGNGAIVNQPRTNGPKRTNSDDALNKAVDCANIVRNKFTEGLDFATITDWTTELRPSMRKLRQAMDGLLKTARLTHSVFRVQEDRRTAQKACNVRYRRHVCFSQALTALVTALMAKLWCQKPDPVFLLILSTVGPLVSFEGLLSYYGDEIDMWGDMVVAVEDLQTVSFTITRCPPNTRQEQVVPKVAKSGSSLSVMLPVPDSVHSLLPLSSPPTTSVTFHVTPVFFNIGINEMATLAESLGATKPQERSNVDNFDRLNQYYHRFRKLNVPSDKRGMVLSGPRYSLEHLVEQLKSSVLVSRSKNVEILHLSSRICRRMKGLRFTSCKSAKDRTGMSVTLEQCNILRSEYDLAEHEFLRALDCMRSEGCRRENTYKNVGVRKYAFNSLQILTLPRLYRPPAGTFGSAQS